MDLAGMVLGWVEKSSESGTLEQDKGSPPIRGICATSRSYKYGVHLESSEYDWKLKSPESGVMGK